MKKISGSECKNPEERSKKKCCCGGHSNKGKKPKKKDHERESPRHIPDTTYEGQR